jgi:hypothetical protein
MMAKRLKILFLFVFLTMGFKVFSEEEDSENYESFSNQVVNVFVRAMKNEFGLLCIGEGGSMPHDIREISVQFNAYQRASIEEARELIVIATERFIQFINAHQKIRPYLREYPATQRTACISISFCKKNHHPYMDGSIALAFVVKNKIFYKKQDPAFQKYELKDLYEEPYEEALEIVQGKAKYDQK